MNSENTLLHRLNVATALRSIHSRKSRPVVELSMFVQPEEKKTRKVEIANESS